MPGCIKGWKYKQRTCWHICGKGHRDHGSGQEPWKRSGRGGEATGKGLHLAEILLALQQNNSSTREVCARLIQKPQPWLPDDISTFQVYANAMQFGQLLSHQNCELRPACASLLSCLHFGLLRRSSCCQVEGGKGFVDTITFWGEHINLSAFEGQMWFFS